MLSIGQFSKICMVTVKALRHYDKLGLIKPDHVDKFTGYRYYDENQIPHMLRILKLKHYGFSLEEIGIILSEDDGKALCRKMALKARKMEAEALEMQCIANEINLLIQEFERTGEFIMLKNNYEIKLEQVDKLPVISLRQVMGVEDFGKYYGLLFEKAAKERIQTTFVTAAVYHDREFDPEASDIEVAVEVADKARAEKSLGGCLCASTTHHGSYSSLPDAYGAIVAWIKENNFEIAAAPYEIYVKNQYDKLPPEQWETKIFFPVKKAK